MKKIILIVLLACVQCCVYAQDQNSGYQSQSYGSSPSSASPSSNDSGNNGANNSYNETWPNTRTQDDTTSGSDMNGNTYLNPEPPATSTGTDDDSANN